jgi:two-component system NtrC family sensor kinase
MGPAVGNDLAMNVDRLKYAVLYVDDEQENLIAFRYALDDKFQIITAKSGAEALEILKQHTVALLLCDQRMPGMTGVELCSRARVAQPDTTRMILTAYSDVDAVIAAINQGQVSRFMLKPWRQEELEQALDAAIEVAHLNATVRELQTRLMKTSSRRVSLAASAEIVHELSNPLAAMTMSLTEASDLTTRVGDAAKRGQVPPLADVEMLHQLQGDFAAGVTQLNAMLRRLRQEGEQESIAGQCDLREVLASVVRMLHRAIAGTAKLDVVAPDSLVVGMDASVAAEIMLNIIINAGQAIEASGKPGRTIRVELRGEAGYAVLTIEDDGPGIAPETLGRLFDARFSTRGVGRGLGLTIARELAWRAGGTISVQSELGQGARFEVRLPLDLAALA